METTLDLAADRIDVRDIIESVESIEEGLLAAFNEQQVIEGDDTETDDPTDSAFREWCKVTVHDDAVEYLQLCKIIDELCGNGGDEQWRGEWFPVTLIRDSYFVDAMIELLEDCGVIPRDIPGYLEIDWEKTADNLRVDYSSVDIDGATYWYR